MTEAQTTFILSMYSKIRPLEGVCVCLLLSTLGVVLSPFEESRAHKH